MDGEAWQATVHGVAKSQTWLSNFTFASLLSGFGKGRGVQESVCLWEICLLKKRGWGEFCADDEDLLLHLQIHSSLFFRVLSWDSTNYIFPLLAGFLLGFVNQGFKKETGKPEGRRNLFEFTCCSRHTCSELGSQQLVLASIMSAPEEGMATYSSIVAWRVPWT